MTEFAVALPALAANATPTTVTIGVFEPSNFNGDTVTNVVLVPPAGYTTVNGVATNNPTLAFRQVRNGVAVSTFATITIGAGVSLIAETPVNVTVASQPGFSPGDVVDVVMTQNGTGLALGAGLIASIYVS